MRKWLALLLIFILSGAGYSIWAISRPLPKLKPSYTIAQQKAVNQTPDIAWSQYGQQALGVTGYGVVATKGEQKAAPMASVAKVMLALAVLDKKPLQLNQTGPNIPISLADVATYQQYYSSGQSVAAVKVGVPLTQYQALQALLLPSANNIATLLANWVFGSQEAYIAEANAYAKKLGMNSTTFADASGFSASTVSTASDLVLLGQAAMQNPVIALVVNQKTATIPVAGVIKNYNLALGIGGIDGIKTGSTDKAGGCLLFSTDFNGTKLIAAIMGAPDRGTALRDAPAIAVSFKKALRTDVVIPTGKILATYTAAWGATTEAHVQKDLKLIDWIGTKHKVAVALNETQAGSKSGDQVGMASFVYQGKTFEGAVVLSNNIARPSIWWRLTHPSTK